MPTVKTRLTIKRLHPLFATIVGHDRGAPFTIRRTVERKGRSSWPAKLDSSGSAPWAGRWRSTSSKAGFALVVHDIDPAKAEPLAAAGAAVADSPAGGGGRSAERTICMVETTEQAEAVIPGEHGIIQRAKPGHIVICMSTIDPFAARRVRRASGGDKGIAMLDAPVSGGTARRAVGRRCR